MSDSPTDRPSGKFVRREYLVDRVFQFSSLRLTVVTTLMYLVVLALSVAVAMLVTQKVEVGSASEGDAQRHWIITGLSLLSLTALLGVQNILTTHRVAGPARKIAAALLNLQHGVYTQFVTLRKTDYLQDLASALNGLARTLTDRDTAVRQATVELANAQAIIVGGGSPAELAPHLSRAVSLLDAARSPDPPASSALIPAVTAARG